ncbi:MAG: hypothetical protein E7656_02100 [Ruminococcaceae bacterium]|nr:hypothetical protein [Oscillospiraceae bacterium]
MGFFNKKKENKKETIEELIRPENERSVYRDGVFEVFEDTSDGKKYGRILKYHGGEKIIDISDKEFALWSDAAENFNKYRITYERDEEFFIEKAHIELATTDTPEKIEEKEQEKPNQPSQAPVSEEDKREFSELVEFYNNAVQSTDVEKATSLSADLAQSIAASALCERKINELISKAKKDAPEGEKIKVQIPKALDNLCQNAKKALFQNVSCAKSLFVIYSEHTKRPHSAAGVALVALTKEVADVTVSEFLSRGQKVYALEFTTTPDISMPPAASRIVSEAASMGLRGIRFIYKFGFSTLIQLNTQELIKKQQFPENILLRAAMSGFFQDLRNGVPAEKLKNAELSMYDALFRATLIQPCMKKNAEKSDELSVAIVKDDRGNCLLELFTSVELTERSESYIRFKNEAPQTSGYKKWSFDELMTEIMSEKTAVNGFIIDKDCIPVPFAGASLDKIVKLKAIWDNNGKSFVKK